MTTTSIPPLMTESVKERTVEIMKSYQWDRCVTLTYRYKTETPDTFLHLHNYIRRINGMNQKKMKYWFGISPNTIGRSPSTEWRDEEFVSVHVHGVIGDVDDLSNIDIAKCWRTTPVRYVDKTTGIETVRPFGLGQSVKVTPFDLDPDWFWYMVKQTPQGWVFTNIEDLKPETV